jgi:hypothetical protein
MSVALSDMPRIGTIDERFQSFNVDRIGLHRGADSGAGGILEGQPATTHWYKMGCSAKRPLDSAGRLTTTPGLAMVAATTSGSPVSLATP